MVPSRSPLWKGALLSLPIAAALGMPGAAQTHSNAQPLITRPVDESSLVTLRGKRTPAGATAIRSRAGSGIVGARNANCWF